MDRPRLYVDFNEMVEPDLVLLAQEDGKVDSSGNTACSVMDWLFTCTWMMSTRTVGEGCSSRTASWRSPQGPGGRRQQDGVVASTLAASAGS